MLGGKPSLKLHEVVDNSYAFPLIVHTGSKSACNAWWLKQPAQQRQNLVVRVAKR